MRKKMTFSKRTGQPILDLEEELIELPLAICNNDGIPITGQKSYATKHLEIRYQSASPAVFGQTFHGFPHAF